MSGQLKALRASLSLQREQNNRWVEIHELGGYPLAADRRRDVVAQYDGWIAMLDEVIAREAAVAHRPCRNCGGHGWRLG